MQRSALRIFTDDSLVEIWRMPLCHGHSWSALAVTTPPPFPQPSSATPAASAALSSSPGMGGDLIVTASYVDLRDLAVDCLSSTVQAGPPLYRDEEADADGARGVLGVISVFEVLGPGSRFSSANHSHTGHQPAHQSASGGGGGGDDSGGDDSVDHDSSATFQVRLVGQLQVPYVVTCLTSCPSSGTLLMAAAGQTHLLTLQHVLEGASNQSGLSVRMQPCHT